ncbi:VOC family protein [Tunturiibacter empetritectus]|uniref:VOC family protein n=1 Tax=Tunturiibacter empetritectus TaxID=3069691 RepID=UPI003D9BE2E1
MYLLHAFPDSHVGKASPSPTDTPSGPEGQELTVEFTVCGRDFLGLNGGPMFIPNAALFNLPSRSFASRRIQRRATHGSRFGFDCSKR